MATKQAITDLSDKIDNILTLLNSQSEELKKVNSQLTEALKKVENLEGEVTSLTKRVTSLELENKRVKDELNTSAMASKSLSVRVLGISSSDHQMRRPSLWTAAGLSSPRYMIGSSNLYSP